jgi:hypothetical protein
VTQRVPTPFGYRLRTVNACDYGSNLRSAACKQVLGIVASQRLAHAPKA